MSEGSKQRRKEKWIESKKKSNLEKYGVEWHSQTQDWKEKTIETSMKRYGTEFYTQTEECKERTRNTCLEKYGVDNMLKSSLSKEGMIRKYGVNNPLKSSKIREKINKTNVERYGLPWITQTDHFKEKSKQFYEERFQVSHNSQVGEILEKRNRSSYSWKTFRFPSGKEVRVQGYEDRVLQDLLEKYHEDDIVVKNAEIEEIVGKIWYKGEDGKNHRYFPDIYVKSENLVVEVKSKWTFEMHKSINLLKEQACKDMNLNFKFHIL